MTSTKMPSLFVGHGSPMNAIQDNRYTKNLKILADKFPRPAAILVISAHWMTKGTWVTHMDQPKTIYDFGGFPQELFDVKYPAPGSPETAQLVQKLLPQVQLDQGEWGLDHGTWAVLRKMYPEADVPVVQLSLDMTKPPEVHVELARELSKLRQEGILILGSGNVVHNLRQIKWEADAPAYDWAIEFDKWVQEKLQKRDFKSLTLDFMKTKAGQLSVPTPEHYFPLLYVIGAAEPSDKLNIEFEEIQNSSISMLSFSFS